MSPVTSMLPPLSCQGTGLYRLVGVPRTVLLCGPLVSHMCSPSFPGPARHVWWAEVCCVTDVTDVQRLCENCGRPALCRVVTFLGELWIRVTCSGLARFGAIGSALVRFASCRETPCARSRASRSPSGPGTTDRRSSATPAGPARSRASVHPLLALHGRVQGSPPRTAL